MCMRHHVCKVEHVICLCPQSVINPCESTSQGVLYLLLEEMTDQHIKEVLLAFVILMQAGAPSGCCLENKIPNISS